MGGVTEGVVFDCGLTVIDISVFALLPELSIANIFTRCVPISIPFGVQLNIPEVAMLLLEILVPLNESVIVYKGFVNPVEVAIKENRVPTAIVVFGVPAGIIIFGLVTVICCEIVETLPEASLVLIVIK